jgi:hypothetical protein
MVPTLARDQTKPRISPNGKGVRFIRQGLSITGLSTPSFKTATENYSKLYALFSRHIEQNTLQQSMVISDFQGHTSVDVSNRYFTPRREGIQENEISFSVEIDPSEVLTKITGTGFYHGEDNFVGYFERITGQDGDSR